MNKENSLSEKLQNAEITLGEKLTIYNNEIKNLALTDLKRNPPKIPNTQQNIICYCSKCKSKYTQDEVNVYLKIREGEVNRIKLNTNSKVEYKKRVQFAHKINSSKAILNIQKNPLDHKQGNEELYNVNPINDDEKEILKNLIRNYEDENFNPNKRMFNKSLNYHSFKWLKNQFLNKISNSLSDLEATIIEEIKTWIAPIKKEKPNEFFNSSNEIYKNIRASKQEKFQDNYFTYLYRLIVIEEKIKYEIYLNNLLYNKMTKSKILNDFQPTEAENTYRLKEIKIAYFCMSESITEDNYLEILNKYSNSRSAKILQNPIYKSNQLTSVPGNKTANTKHLKALNNAKRLLSGIKNDEALKSINQFISTFKSNIEKFMQ